LKAGFGDSITSNTTLKIERIFFKFDVDAVRDRGTLLELGQAELLRTKRPALLQLNQVTYMGACVALVALQ